MLTLFILIFKKKIYQIFEDQNDCVLGKVGNRSRKYLIGANVLDIHGIFEISLRFLNGSTQIPWKNILFLHYLFAKYVMCTWWKSFNWSWWNKLLVCMLCSTFDMRTRRKNSKSYEINFLIAEREKNTETKSQSQFNRMETMWLEVIKQMVELWKSFWKKKKIREGKKVVSKHSMERWKNGSVLINMHPFLCSYIALNWLYT